MPADPTPLVTPAILPSDVEHHQDDIPAEADDLEAGQNNPTEDDIVETPERAISQIPVGGTGDEPDAGRRLNSRSPNAR